ncbi:hypothetical protein DL766_004372 [Monosporascus sp. MC13-8B]|uniref:Uncharacterized protein n=1 Tax=Monosporascus cannonballus TaxID=155416 RepID=A0ABY0HJK9_9PEZI|nr:hypothetical protein DL762_000216 [Monosporascus cannonballus]RYO99392.1 hypothetical protein DL763_001566 [Monosporascus cannonballus]RYP31434.1 hypothetical protein DL766_004372 [Monosporascus sp. MC13-8B]
MAHNHKTTPGAPCDHKTIPDSISSFIQWHICKYGLFRGYEVSSCGDKSTLQTDAKPKSITRLYLDVDRALNKDQAREILKNLDTMIETNLLSSQKPTNLAYHLTNDSSVEFWAKSRKVKGELRVDECVERDTRPVSRLPDDGNDEDPTPPASPRSDVAHLYQEKEVEVIDI